MSYRVRLEMFEGPLDLLLYLIQVNEIDIYDIPIAKITQEYLGCLARMEELDLKVAGEFLVLAATLIHIKSKMLIPVQELEAEGVSAEDPRQELVERLLEYRRFKEAAMEFEELEAGQALLYGRPGDLSVPIVEGPLEVSLSALLRAFMAVMQRAPETMAVEITPETINVGERMVAVLDRLTLQSPVPFLALFEGVTTRALLIATFLGLLELLRRGLVRARQSEPGSEITIYRTVETAVGADGHQG
ncbi:segregation/condensation protein A [Candidatus Methylomirabilis sp.]|uniref:segregation and condensation protein A n=1 Tax=Candidatus Methylomirabilis sp. TaxID=2032687 RepID=UPI002A605518|nr:segregation/condensation protein A [Candidatus Methylomirabilis sp.]